MSFKEYQKGKIKEIDNNIKSLKNQIKDLEKIKKEVKEAKTKFKIITILGIGFIDKVIKK